LSQKGLLDITSMITSPSEMARSIRAKKRKLTNQLDPVLSPSHGPDSQHLHHTKENQSSHEHHHTTTQDGCQYHSGAEDLISPIAKKARSTPASPSSVQHQETYTQDQNTNTQTNQTQNLSHQDHQTPSLHPASTRRPTEVLRPAGGGFASSPLNLFRGPSRNQIMRHVASLNNLWRRSAQSTDPVHADADIVVSSEDVDIVREFDHEVSVAVTRIGGSLLGLNAHPDQLMDSPGVRKLVARNLAWFHGSSDFFKLCGLLLAKKINRVIEKQIPNALASAPVSLLYATQPTQEETAQMVTTESLGPVSDSAPSSVLLLGTGDRMHTMQS
jgi:hypothetical protein